MLSPSFHGHSVPAIVDVYRDPPGMKNGAGGHDFEWFFHLGSPGPCA